jgi:hypothetical protein
LFGASETMVQCTKFWCETDFIHAFLEWVGGKTTLFGSEETG